MTVLDFLRSVIRREIQGCEKERFLAITPRRLSMA
jgi:hypothetical protein